MHIIAWICQKLFLYLHEISKGVMCPNLKWKYTHVEIQAWNTSLEINNFQLTDTFSGNFFGAPDKILKYNVPAMSTGDFRYFSHITQINCRQNVRQIKSRVGQNRIFKFSAGQMSDVRRYFKAWKQLAS